MHEQYDDLVRESPQGSVFATSWWLDAVAEGRWRANAVEDNGEVVAAWPTVVRETRWGELHEGAPLTPFLGPLFRREGSELKRRANEVKRLEQLAAAFSGAAHVEARCNPAFDYWTPLAWHGFSQTTRYTWRLGKLADLEAVFAEARENIRREVRKAHKRGVSVSRASLRELTSLNERTGGAAATTRTLERVQTAAEPRGASTILGARDSDGRLHAAGYFVYDDRFAYYLLGASDPELRTSGAPSLLLWTAIEQAAERELGFDFEGSMVRGVERFFRAFGGEPAPYSIVRKTPSLALRVSRPVKRALRSLR
jgi:hypothetical protein